MAKKKTRKPELHSCEFVSLSEVLTSDLPEDLLSDSDFSWGSNNRTLVTASALADDIQKHAEETPAVTRLLRRLCVLGETYVDLES